MSWNPFPVSILIRRFIILRRRWWWWIIPPKINQWRGR